MQGQKWKNRSACMKKCHTGSEKILRWHFWNRNFSVIQGDSIKEKEEMETCSGAISLHETKNPREEARYVAESIRKLVREKDYRYRDIAVIAADLNLYADALEKACELFEIPVFMDHKKVFCSIHL